MGDAGYERAQKRWSEQELLALAANEPSTLR